MTDDRARCAVNEVAFITQALLPKLDELEETTQPKREFKFHLKKAIIEAEKIVAKHFGAYENHGNVTQPDGTAIDAKDVYYITARAYDQLLNRPPHQLAVIAEMVRKWEQSGVDWLNYGIAANKVE